MAASHQTRIPLGEWKDRLALSRHKPPELYEKAGDVGNVPHANSLRKTFNALNASAVFCVDDVPALVMCVTDQHDPNTVDTLRKALWNQGLAGALLVISQDEKAVRVFSLAQVSNPKEECLVKCLCFPDDGRELQDFIHSVESGRFWNDHEERFRLRERVDQVLLDHLTQAHQRLCQAQEPLSETQARTVLLQTMFLAYLEDREILDAGSLQDLLQQKHSDGLKKLFAHLSDTFHGDLFTNLCAFGEEESGRNDLSEEHLEILAQFRTGQTRHWGYDFRHIPVEWISAVCDRFLAATGFRRHREGADHTPASLADITVAQVWAELPEQAKRDGMFLDPACGSGMFLVRTLQYLCGEERLRSQSLAGSLKWDSLNRIATRLHGMDTDGGAVRVAVFSLYLALLDEMEPQDIRELVARDDRQLPKLWNESLREQDFFAVPVKSAPDYAAILGNPPWSGRHEGDISAHQWSQKHGYALPDEELAWAFVWKTSAHLSQDGLAAFLLPARSFLHDCAKPAQDSRKRLLRDTSVKRVINFSDLRRGLFDHAARPSSLILFGHLSRKHPQGRFDYWTPKASPGFRSRRVVSVSEAEKEWPMSRMVEENPRLYKHFFWLDEADAKLFRHVSDFTRMESQNWTIGDGIGTSWEESSVHEGGSLTEKPSLDTRDMTPLVQANGSMEDTSYERLAEGRSGSRVIVTSDVSLRKKRLRAAYTEDTFLCTGDVFVIHVPAGEERKAHVLTALLNSKLSLWFAFHETASLGAERPRIDLEEWLRMPFPVVEDRFQPERFEKAEQELARLVSEEWDRAQQGKARTPDAELFEELDRWTYKFFGLTQREIHIIEDTVGHIMPSAMPAPDGFPDIWKPTTPSVREQYADALSQALNKWFERKRVSVRLIARNGDLAVLRASLTEQAQSYREEEADRSLHRVLADLSEQYGIAVPGNLQSVPDFRFFADGYLYLVKSNQRRFWLRSSAFSDSSDIVAGLQESIMEDQREGRIPITAGF